MNYQEKLQTVFDGIYDSLNDAQRQAVDTIEGPVMVIAGPGTGKTQILAARIGRILLDTDAQPDNILCLTYTEAGSIAMRKRLLQFMGPDAYRVQISTFHAFCNQVIQENMPLFGIRELEPVSDLEQIEILQKVMDGFDKTNVLKRWRSEEYGDLGRLKRFFQLIKKEGWKVEDLENFLQDFIGRMPDMDEYKYKRKTKNNLAGDVNMNKLTADKNKFERTLAATKAFTEYSRLMSERMRYDYEDMILWVKEKFENPVHQHLLLNYQERFQYVLVDEFQDTSGAQSAILYALCDYDAAPNVFVVGDDDQSIYKFQGASMSNIIDFQKHYPSTKMVVLTENYRSTQKILDAAGALIDHNQMRLLRGDMKKLEARSYGTNAGNDIRILSCSSPAEESLQIGREISRLIENGECQAEEIAVLYRQHKMVDDLQAYLISKKIPYQMRKSISLFDSVPVQQILEMMYYAQEELDIPHSAERRLFQILHFPFWGISALALAQMAAHLRQQSFAQSGVRMSWRELLSKMRNPSSIGLDIHADVAEKIVRAAASLENIIGQLFNHSLQQWVDFLMKESGLLNYYLNQSNRFEALSEIRSFFQFLKEETARKGNCRLSDFLTTLQLMERNEINLPLEKLLPNEKGVNLITCHSAKGLEFRHVFILAAQADKWEKKRSQGDGFTVPSEFVKAADENIMEEERRLFYVAMTRAKEQLQISYSTGNGNGKEAEASLFVEELIDSGAGIEQKAQTTEKEMADFVADVLGEKPLPPLELIEKRVLDDILQNYALSPTHLSKYLECPRSFYYENLLQIPSPKNENTAFGTAVHYALERLFEKMLERKGVFPLKDEMLRDFEWMMRRQRESFTDEAFARRMEYGQLFLPLYYEEHQASWNKNVSLERKLRTVVVNNIPITGRLDKVEFSGKDANVVDYKTGKADSAIKHGSFLRPGVKSGKDVPDHVKQYGGNYWRQAVFYKLLIDHEPRIDWKVLSSEFDFVEPTEGLNRDVKAVFFRQRIDITDEDVDMLKEQISEVYPRIMAHDFQKGCEKEYCYWCQLAKEGTR